MEFRTEKIDLARACEQLEAVTPRGFTDPIDAFRDANGELVESEEFFEFVHAESVHRVLSGR